MATRKPKREAKAVGPDRRLPFAKLFGTDENQILVVFGDADDDDSDEDLEAKITVSFQPRRMKGGTCSISFSFDSWAKGYLAFGKYDETEARRVVEKLEAGLLKGITTTKVDE